MIPECLPGRWCCWHWGRELPPEYSISAQESESEKSYLVKEAQHRYVCQVSAPENWQFWADMFCNICEGKQMTNIMKINPWHCLFLWFTNSWAFAHWRDRWRESDPQSCPLSSGPSLKIKTTYLHITNIIIQIYQNQYQYHNHIFCQETIFLGHSLKIIRLLLYVINCPVCLVSGQSQHFPLGQE